MNRDLVNRRCFLRTSALYAACTSALATPFAFSLDPATCATTSNNITVYDLRDDTLGIESTQRTSLQSDYGIEPKPALFGSDEWWRILGTEELPLFTIEGVISKVYMSGHNDFPEFELKSGSTKTHWMRLGNDSVYVIGRPMQISYTFLKLKEHDILSNFTLIDCVTKITAQKKYY